MLTLQINHAELKRIWEMYRQNEDDIPDYYHLINGIHRGNYMDLDKPFYCVGMIKPSGEALGREGDTMAYYLVLQNNEDKGAFCNLDWGTNRIELNGSTFDTYCGQSLFEIKNNYNDLRREERGHAPLYGWVPICVAHPTHNSLAKKALDLL